MEYVGFRLFTYMESTLNGVQGVKVEYISANNPKNPSHTTVPLSFILLSKSFIYSWEISFCANQIFPKTTVQLTASMESCCWTTLRPLYQKKHHQVQQFLDNLRYLQCPKLQAAIQTTLLGQLEKVVTLKMFTKMFIFCWKY